MSEYDQAFIYMPLDQAQLFFGTGGDVDAIEMKVDNPDLMDTYLPGLRAAAGRGAVVSDWRDTNAQFFGALQVERTMMRLIMMLIVLIAALNIISGLVMLVKNKERDIAILRTMGAGQAAIMRVFLMSGAAVGVLATPVGVVLGVVFCIYITPIQNFVEWVTGAQVFNSAVYFLPSLPAKLDWQEVVFVSAWTFSISILVTILPSWRASRIDPVEALRYE
jgi:lipoprotein-releasing system permease protein